MAGWRPAPWVTKLAEELAEVAAKTVLDQDPAGVAMISGKLREASAAHGNYDRWMLTQQVASEWHRLGIITIPGGIPLSRAR